MFNKKTLKNKSDFFVAVVLLAGILAVLNFLAYKNFYRLDLTENEIYSISDASKNLAENLDDVVNVKLYFSENLPSQYLGLKQEVRDILAEYETYAKSDLRVENINPDEMEDPENELARLGIPPLIFDVIEKDKRQTVKGFLGISIQSGDRQEIIPAVTSISDFEYQFSLALKKAIKGERPVLGVVNGFGSLDLSTEASLLSQKLQEVYEVRPIDLAETEQINSDVETLLVLGPKESFGEDNLVKIDDFVMGGGSLILAVDGAVIDEQLSANDNQTDINDLVSSYGLEIEKKLVLDRQAEQVRFSTGFLPFYVQYPFWPQVLASGLSSDNVISSNLEKLAFAWVSPIKIDESKIGGEDRKINYLVRSGQNSWTESAPYNLNPQQNFAPSDAGKRNLAVYFSGDVKSAFSENSAKIRLAAVGDSNFISDNFLQRSPDNLIFFQNLVDALSFDEDLINIRSKEVSSRPIKELSEAEKSLWRYGNVFALSVLFVAFGLFRYYRRVKR